MNISIKKKHKTQKESRFFNKTNLLFFLIIYLYIPLIQRTHLFWVWFIYIYIYKGCVKVQLYIFFKSELFKALFIQNKQINIHTIHDKF